MTTFIGIDPGVGGGMVALGNGDVSTCKGDLAIQDVWGWLCVRAVAGPCFAVIEQQTPRPTRYVDKGGQFHSTVLASTCVLYGNYMMLKGLLVAAEIPFEDCPPQRWQKALNVPAKEKGEAEGKWKSRLRRKAKELFPREQVTLWNCDAFLIAEHARRKMGKTLQETDDAKAQVQ